MKVNMVLAFLLIVILFSPAYAQMMPMMGMGVFMGTMEAEHETHVHPFLAHMGMPDMPGEISLKITGFQQRSGGVSENGYGAHLETGLWDRVGLHIRNDDIQREGNEIMLQFALLRSQDKEEGIAIIFENEMPGPTGETTAKFKTGFTAVKMFWGQPLHLAFHYGASDKMSEYTASQIINVNERLSLILEYSGSSNASNVAYLLEALKVRMTPFMNLGIAFQSPLSADKDFDARTLLQMDMSI